MKIRLKIKQIMLTFIGTVLTYFFSTKKFAQSLSFYYGPGDYEPVPKTTWKNLEWWLELPLKYVLPAILVVAAAIIGLVVIIKRRGKTNAKNRPPKIVDNTQGKDKKGS